MPQDKLVKFGLHNAGSLATNHDEFIIAMSHHSVDIMAINETWLRKGEEGRAPSVPGYQLRHIPRPMTIRDGRGGGVAFYIKSGMSTRARTHPHHPTVEQMWISLTTKTKKLFVGTAYRPPWLGLDVFLEAITDSICALAPYDNLILLGDFNVNMAVNNGLSETLSNFLTHHNLEQVVTTPTHFVGDSSTLIDVICTDAQYRDVTVDHISELGNHSFVTCEILFRKEKPTYRIVTYRPINDIIIEQFERDLQAIPWAAICDLENVNDMVDVFNKCTTHLFNTHAPIKRRSFKGSPTPLDNR